MLPPSASLLVQVRVGRCCRRHAILTTRGVSSTRAERVYDRDAVLGRDSTSVFPTEIAAAAAADRSAAAEAIGGRTFITETEVRFNPAASCASRPPCRGSGAQSTCMRPIGSNLLAVETATCFPIDPTEISSLLTFVSVSVEQLEALKAEKAAEQAPSESAAPNDGKSLAVVLAENKQAKEDAFQAQWTQMKTGSRLPKALLCSR